MASTTPTTGAQRILIGAPAAVLRVTLSDQDGNPADAAGTVTVTVTRADGTVIVTGAATTNPTGVGTYTYTLSAAAVASYDVLTAVWSDTGVVRATSRHRIVGGFLFSRDQLKAMTGVGTFSPEELDAARDHVTDQFERYLRQAIAPTYDIDAFTTLGALFHVLPHRPVRTLRSCTVNAQTVSTTSFVVNELSGRIQGPWFYGSCTVGYEHGPDGPSRELRDAALQTARDVLLRERSGISSRARSQTNEMGATTQFAFAGKDHPTGIDEVDALLVSMRDKSAGFA
jgi:hypothetical protein